jgi:ribosomal protein S18 acetylase RimI-like enzyme
VQLVATTDEQLLQIKSWFSSFEEIYTWGGPNMVYPMSDGDFLRVVKTKDIHSYCLQDDHAQVVAFGQFYPRLGRNHLGRLAVNPDQRGQGLSKVLIQKLLIEADNSFPNRDVSLFVFKNNVIAYQCYLSLGFEETEYPDTPFPGNMQNCVYMVLPIAK